jgi:cytidine deaminase
MKELIEAARQARERAYAPYSEYRVGAAVLDEQGRLHTGCNVENVSYPVTLCAERVAIGKMVSEGGRRIEALAVATKDGGTPCGMCLQVISEFAGADMPVVVVAEDGSEQGFRFADLMPHGFRSAEV